METVHCVQRRLRCEWRSVDPPRDTEQLHYITYMRHLSCSPITVNLAHESEHMLRCSTAAYQISTWLVHHLFHENTNMISGFKIRHYEVAPTSSADTKWTPVDDYVIVTPQSTMKYTRVASVFQ